MTLKWKRSIGCSLLLVAGLCGGTPGLADDRPADGDGNASDELCVLVTDPLAKENACACVAGFAQRRYDALALVLERRLRRPCVAFTGTNLKAYWDDQSQVHLIVGKHSEVLHQAKQLERKVYPVASLSNRDGKTIFRGLFVVRNGNSAQTLADLEDYKVILGPAACDEKNSAAITKLKQVGVKGFTTDSEPAAACTDAAAQLMKTEDKDKVVAVISDYARVLLEGCGTIAPGALRIVGETDPLPFITAFATEDLTVEQRKAVQAELLQAGRFKMLLKLLETKKGFLPFVAPPEADSNQLGWMNFRGPNRNGLVPKLPDTLALLRPVWTSALSEQGLGGVAATKRWVVATDHNTERNSDSLKIFAAATGRLVQEANLIRPPSQHPDKSLDYGNSIRSTPLIQDGRVYVLDAYGTLFVDRFPSQLPSGKSVAKVTLHGVRTESMVEGYDLAEWGVASTPLIVGDSLIVNVCGTETTLLALKQTSREVLWRSAGKGTGYASCITGVFGGRSQIVGYQSRSISGWGSESGELLWNVVPEIDGDFNVPTPIAVGEDHLLVATENNGMRLYQFDFNGMLSPEPIAVNEDITPDTVTPVVVGRHAYCTTGRELVRADLQKGLKVDWSFGDDALINHASLIADTAGRRLLLVTFGGELLLFDIADDMPRLNSRRSAFLIPRDEAIYSHPAIVGNRLYLRGINSLTCVAF